MSSELLGVVLLPALSSGWSDVVSSVSLLSETSVLLTSGGESSDFSSVVLVGDNPVDSWVSLDGVMVWVNADNLEELLGSVLSNPVGGEDSQVRAVSSDLLFSNGSVRSGLLELSDTLMDWLTEDSSLMDLSLSSSSSDLASVDDVSLLLLESEGSGLIESGWSSNLMDGGELSVFPASNSHDESDNIRLLLSPQFLQVLVGSHYYLIFK